MAHNRKHREVPNYFKRDPKGESSMVPDYLEGRQEVLDATGLPNEAEYLQWASENREMLGKFMTALGGSEAMSFMTGQNRESKPAGEYFLERDPKGESGMVDDYLQRREDFFKEHREVPDYFKRDPKGESGMVDDYLGGQTEAPKAEAPQAPKGRLDFKGTWAVPTKEQVSKSESKAADRENYRKQKGNRDSQGTLMTAAQQEAEADRIYNEYGKTMGTHVLEDEEDRVFNEYGKTMGTHVLEDEEDRVFNEYGKTMGTHVLEDEDWDMNDWAGWFSNVAGEPSGKKPPRNSPRGK